jgi:iron(III) transport system ATP-binding protein
VLLFDEPLSNLDARLRRSMREEIRSLQRRLSLTVAYVTHDQAEALAVSDQIIVMDQGRVAQAGTPHELYERPTSAFVAGFMGEALLFDGEALADGSVRLGPLTIRPVSALPPGAAKVAVRPEAWAVLPAGAGALGATVVKSAYLGSTHEYTFDTELGAVFVVSPHVTRMLAPGERVSLALTGHGVSVVAA